jgi:hypothetical protein
LCLLKMTFPLRAWLVLLLSCTTPRAGHGSPRTAGLCACLVVAVLLA